MKRCLILLFVAFVLCAGVAARKKATVAAATVRSGTQHLDAWQKALYYDALDACERNELDYALALLQMLKYDNDNIGGYYALEGRIFEKINYSLGARLAWYRAYLEEEDNWDYAKHVVLLTMNSAKSEFLIDILEKSAKQHPDNPEVWHMLAYCYQYASDIPNHNKKALDAYGKYEQISGINAYTTKAKAQIYYEMGKRKKVIQTIDQLISDYPDDDSYKVLLGDIYLRQHKLDEAYKVYCDVQQQYPNNPYVYISLAQYWQEKGDVDKGRQYLYDAIDNPELELEAKLQIVEELSEKMTNSAANVEQYEALLNSLRAQFPYEEVIIRSQYLLYKSQDRTDEARTAVLDLLDINPKYTAAWYSLLQLTSDDDERLPIINKAMQAVDTLAQYDFLSERMLWYYRHSDYDNALTDLNVCIAEAERKENYAALRSLYQIKADLYCATKSYDNAIEYYEKTIKLSPNNPLTLNNFAYTLANRDSVGDLRRAERMSAKAVENEPDNPAYLDTYAWILYKQGSFTLAAFYMKKLLSQDLEQLHDDVYIEHGMKIYEATSDAVLLEKINKIKNRKE